MIDKQPDVLFTRKTDLSVPRSMLVRRFTFRSLLATCLMLCWLGMAEIVAAQYEWINDWIVEEGFAISAGARFHLKIFT